MTTWSDGQMASIHKMLNPQSIAIVGATPRMQYGGRLLAASLKAGERVRVYPVNPRYDEVQGVKSYPNVSALPEGPDLVCIVVPYHQVLPVLEECREKGAGSAVIISAGFSERGDSEREDLQGQLGVFARESGIRLCGPNCLGLANVKDNVWATASSRMSSGLTGSIGMVCQSGASAFGPFLVRSVDAQIGFSYIVSTGNEADLDFADFARYLVDDDSTRVIAGFVEGFKDARKFMEVAELAAERGKPIVLIKIGRSDLGANAARSHTASLSGDDDRYEAMFKQYGVVRVTDYDSFLEVAHTLANTPKPLRPGLGVVSHSGGISSLTADLCGDAGLNLPPLSQNALDRINDILKGFGWAANPADVTGRANSEFFPEIMDAIISDPEVGTLVVASAGADAQAEQVIQMRDQSDKGVVFLWTGSRGATAGLDKLKAAQVPVFYLPASLASALKHRLDYHTWREWRLTDGFAQALDMTSSQQKTVEALRSLSRSTLSESESKGVVAAWGVPISREQLATSVDEAVAAAEHIGYPVALKVDSSDILHKTEAGVLRLGLQDAGQVRAAYAEVMSNAAQHAPEAQLAGVSVQEMVTDGVEVIIGVSYDTQLGPMLLFGTGGVLVEVYSDVTLRCCPITRREAFDMIAEVKGAKLLHGFRGSPRSDVDALADTLVQISQLAVHLEGQLAELDINPLLVLPEGQGVKAVDALVVLDAQD